MAYSIKFTNPTGTLDTIDFMAGNGVYRITDWEPAVAARRDSALGGLAYDDVDEEMTLSIKNPNPSVWVTSSLLFPLQNMFDRATDWGNGATVSPILLEYKAANTVATMYAAILGPIAPGVPILELPRGHTLSETTSVINGVKLRFRRRGQWLVAPLTGPSDTAQMPNPGVQQIYFLADYIRSAGPRPYTIKFNPVTNLGMFDNSFVLAGQGMALIDAAAYTKSTGFTAVSDTPSKASGNVLRFTPFNTSERYQSLNGPWGVGVGEPQGHRFAVFFNYRNNSATTSFRVRFEFSDVLTSSTPVTLIPAGVSSPKWVYAGTVTSTNGWGGYLTLLAQGSAASGSLDIDSVAILNLSTTDARVIALNAPMLNAAGAPVTIDHRLLTHLTPTVRYREPVSGSVTLTHRGNIYLYTSYAGIKVMLLMAHNSYWVGMDSSNNAATVYLTCSLAGAGVVP